MASLPFMQFYVADYLRDTQILSLAAQGAWVRILCNMWHPARKGVLSLPLDALARLLSVSEEITRNILEEISQCGVADIQWGGHGDPIATPCTPYVTVTSRRMVRDWSEHHEKKQNMSDGGKKGAQIRWGNRGGNGPPIPPLNDPANSPPISPPYGISEGRSQSIISPQPPSQGESGGGDASLIAQVKSLRSQWGTGDRLDARNLRTFQKNRDCWRAYTPDDWLVVTEFMRAPLPEGTAYTQPRQIRMALGMPDSLLGDARDWKSKQRGKPAPAFKVLPPPDPEEIPTEEERKTLLKLS